jgi:hypothetical protein
MKKALFALALGLGITIGGLGFTSQPTTSQPARVDRSYACGTDGSRWVCTIEVEIATPAHPACSCWSQPGSGISHCTCW